MTSSLITRSLKKDKGERTILSTGETIYHFDDVLVKAERPDGSEVMWLIQLSARLNHERPVYHYIETRTKSRFDVECGLEGKVQSKIYDNDAAFERAIKRIEKIVKK